MVAQLCAIDPVGLGVAVRCPAGPMRDAWLAVLRQSLPVSLALRRVPLGVADDRLLGGLDLAATLSAGRPVHARGLLAEAEGGVLLLPMAERLAPGMAARLGAAWDGGARFGVVALDEGVEDERMPAGLLDRLAFPLLLDEAPPGTGVPSRQGGPEQHTTVMPGLDPGIHGVPHTPVPTEIHGQVADRRHAPDAVDARIKSWHDGVLDVARALLPAVTAGPDIMEALCVTAAALGIASMRAPTLALRAARAAAALDGRGDVSAEDAALAGRLVLAPRATQLPASGEEEAGDQEADDAPPETDPNASREPDPGETDKPLEDRVLEAAQAAIPAGLLAQLQDQAAGRSRSVTGKSGALGRAGQRGRPAGVRAGDPRRGLRLNLIETLRAAAPWQGTRRPPGQTRIAVRPGDIRVTHLKQRSETTTIFVVDASGSAALARLAEAKGAVELLLAECYVRRDRVAVMAFRGRAAQLLLPPTRSLVRAKRALAGLPGGGGTPLAAGIDAGLALAADVRRRGGTPTLVLLTDGRANVARDGKGNRARAEEDASAAARQLRAAGLRVLLVDTSTRPHAPNERLAMQMGARYLPLPYADAASLSRTIQANR